MCDELNTTYLLIARLKNTQNFCSGTRYLQKNATSSRSFFNCCFNITKLFYTTHRHDTHRMRDPALCHYSPSRQSSFSCRCVTSSTVILLPLDYGTAIRGNQSLTERLSRSTLDALSLIHI